MISLILLASGYGRRFGSNKLLYEINGKPMYLHILEKLHRLSLHRIEIESVENPEKGINRMDLHKTDRKTKKIHDIRCVVVSQYAEILDTARSYGLIAVKNDSPEEGIAASVRLGSQASEDADWMVFFTADQPFLKEDTISSFIISSILSGKSMASSHSEGKPGNPTAFSSIWREELKNLIGDRGGRKIMKAHPEEVFWYEISAEEKKDIDFPENLA